MTGRQGMVPERQNEYFIAGDGISREVIQADICRYLGNDALNRQGYFIRAYRNLTSEMIADLKSDSARWEAEVARRADSGYPRGTYVQDVNLSRSPNAPSASYASSSIHELRQQGGPSPPPYTSAQTQYIDPYVQQPAYGPTQNTAYPTAYTNTPSYVPGPGPYGQQIQQIPFSTAPQPSVSTPDIHPAYTYSSNTTGYTYENTRNTAPRYPGPGYENDSDYTPGTSSISYPTTAAPDTRIGIEPRYPSEGPFGTHGSQASRPQQTRENQPHRRGR